MDEILVGTQEGVEELRGNPSAVAKLNNPTPGATCSVAQQQLLLGGGITVEELLNDHHLERRKAGIIQEPESQEESPDKHKAKAALGWMADAEEESLQDVSPTDSPRGQPPGLHREASRQSRWTVKSVASIDTDLVWTETGAEEVNQQARASVALNHPKAGKIITFDELIVLEDKIQRQGLEIDDLIQKGHLVERPKSSPHDQVRSPGEEDHIAAPEGPTPQMHNDSRRSRWTTQSVTECQVDLVWTEKGAREVNQEARASEALKNPECGRALRMDELITLEDHIQRKGWEIDDLIREGHLEQRPRPVHDDHDELMALDLDDEKVLDVMPSDSAKHVPSSLLGVVPAPTSEPVVLKPSEASSKKDVCAKCNLSFRNLPEKAQFCPECGTKRGAPAAVSNNSAKKDQAKIPLISAAEKGDNDEVEVRRSRRGRKFLPCIGITLVAVLLMVVLAVVLVIVFSEDAKPGVGCLATDYIFLNETSGIQECVAECPEDTAPMTLNGNGAAGVSRQCWASTLTGTQFRELEVPFVVETSPVLGGREVSPTTSLNFTFNVPVEIENLDGIIVRSSASQELVDVSIVEVHDATLVVQLAALLDPGITYTMSLLDGACKSTSDVTQQLSLAMPESSFTTADTFTYTSVSENISLEGLDYASFASDAEQVRALRNQMIEEYARANGIDPSLIRIDFSNDTSA